MSLNGDTCYKAEPVSRFRHHNAEAARHPEYIRGFLCALISCFGCGAGRLTSRCLLFWRPRQSSFAICPDSALYCAQFILRWQIYRFHVEEVLPQDACWLLQGVLQLAIPLIWVYVYYIIVRTSSSRAGVFIAYLHISLDQRCHSCDPILILPEAGGALRIGGWRSLTVINEVARHGGNSERRGARGEKDGRRMIIGNNRRRNGIRGDPMRTGALIDTSVGKAFYSTIYMHPIR